VTVTTLSSSTRSDDASACVARQCSKRRRQIQRVSAAVIVGLAVCRSETDTTSQRCYNQMQLLI
jgi:hypothetical protein